MASKRKVCRVGKSCGAQLSPSEKASCALPSVDEALIEFTDGETVGQGCFASVVKAIWRGVAVAAKVLKRKTLTLSPAKSSGTRKRSA